MDDDEKRARRDYIGAQGWMISLPGNGMLPAGYACDDPLEGWLGTILITAAARFDTRRGAESVLRSAFGWAKGATVTPCVPNSVITHTGPHGCRAQKAQVYNVS